MEAVQGSIRKAPQTRLSPRAWRARPAREGRHITTVVVRLEREDLLMLEADVAMQEQGPKKEARLNSSEQKTLAVDCWALLRGQTNFYEVLWLGGPYSGWSRIWQGETKRGKFRTETIICLKTAKEALLGGNGQCITKQFP